MQFTLARCDQAFLSIEESQQVRSPGLGQAHRWRLALGAGRLRQLAPMAPLPLREAVMAVVDILRCGSTRFMRGGMTPSRYFIPSYDMIQILWYETAGDQMGRKGVTYEEVARIADAMLAEGISPDDISPRTVRVRLGDRGSNTTIGGHLATWRQKRAEAGAAPVRLVLPDAIAQPIAAFIEAQCEAARAPLKQELAGERAARAAADSETQRLQDELDEARARIAEFEVTVAEFSGRLKQAKDAYDALDGKLTAAQREAADAEKAAAVSEARFEAAERRAGDAESRTDAALARAAAAERRAAEAESHAAAATARAGASSKGR